MVSYGRFSLPHILLDFKNIKEIIFFIIRKKLKTTYARNSIWSGMKNKEKNHLSVNTIIKLIIYF